MKESSLVELEKISHYLDYSNNCVQMCTLAVKVDHISALIEIYKQSVLYNISLNGYKEKVNLLQNELSQMKEKLENYHTLCTLSEEDYFDETNMNELLTFCASVDSKSMSFDEFKKGMAIQPHLSELVIDTYEKINFDSHEQLDMMASIRSTTELINQSIERNQLNCNSFDLSEWDNEKIATSFEKWMYYVHDFNQLLIELMRSYIEEIKDEIKNKQCE